MAPLEAAAKAPLLIPDLNPDDVGQALDGGPVMGVAHRYMRDVPYRWPSLTPFSWGGGTAMGEQPITQSTAVLMDAVQTHARCGALGVLIRSDHNLSSNGLLRRVVPGAQLGRAGGELPGPLPRAKRAPRRAGQQVQLPLCLLLTKVVTHRLTCQACLAGGDKVGLAPDVAVGPELVIEMTLLVIISHITYLQPGQPRLIMVLIQICSRAAP